ncbi:MAG TPA: ABC transporter permease [Solirubrobacteraceae bacterium]|nr:ABC transporter permease [Solirubrobacteraceae bacterium]
MARFLVRRLFSMAIVMIVISILTFLLFEAIPNGNPAYRLAGRNATPQEIHQIEVKYGFNKPIYVQYVRTMENIFTAQAVSYTQGYNVDSELWQDLPVTLWLSFGASVLWLVSAVLIGVVGAVRQGKFADRFLNILAMIGVSMPPYFLGAVFLYYFSYKAGIFPISNYVPIGQSIGGWFMHLFLPWVTLAILYVGFYSRVLRSNILDTLNEDYVRTARAKGLSPRRVLVRHVLRNSLIPIISLWGLDFAAIIGGGAILIESLFGLNGVGNLTFQSIGRLDVVVILVVVILTSFAVVILAAIVDILYAYLDPRIRLS